MLLLLCCYRGGELAKLILSQRISLLWWLDLWLIHIIYVCRFMRLPPFALRHPFNSLRVYHPIKFFFDSLADMVFKFWARPLKDGRRTSMRMTSAPSYLPNTSSFCRHSSSSIHIVVLLTASDGNCLMIWAFLIRNPGLASIWLLLLQLLLPFCCKVAVIIILAWYCLFARPSWKSYCPHYSENRFMNQ